MNKEKHDQLLKTDKYEAIMFSIDYIRSIRTITGDVDENDYVDSLLTLYDVAFNNGCRNILDLNINSLYQQYDTLEGE